MSDARDELDWKGAKSADMVDLAHRLGTRLKRSGHDFIGPCPLGCAREDGFVVTPAKRLFLCRPSAARGDAVDMAEHVLGCSKLEALAYITGREPARRTRANEDVRAKPKPPIIVAAATTTEDAMALWRPAIDPRETLGQRYFNIERKLDLSADLCGEVLRWHPGIAAILALFRNIMTGEPQAISRIFLDRDGRKIERTFLGPVGGAAIMLDAFDEVLEGLHVGEGVETCMTGRQRYGFKPMWALGSTSGIMSFPVLAGVECLTLLRENDGGKSATTCERCAARWHAAGREVRIDDPDQEFKDLNDILISGAVE